MNKSQIGKFFQFQFPKRKEQVFGIVLNYNEEWTLIKRAYDYQLDGYFIFKNYKVQATKGEHEKFADKIFKLKNYSPNKVPKIPLDSLDNIFSYIQMKYKLVQLDTIDGSACDVLKYNGFKGGLYLFDELTVRAKWRYKLKLSEKEIRYIAFDNDYLNSLKLAAKWK